MTAEEEAGWCQVELIITSVPSQDNTKNNPGRERGVLPAQQHARLPTACCAGAPAACGQRGAPKRTNRAHHCARQGPE